MNNVTTARYIAFTLSVRDLCILHHASVISWWRTTHHNRTVGGHTESFHLEGLAADLEPDDPETLDALAIDARARGLQVSLRETTAHVELDYRHP